MEKVRQQLDEQKALNEGESAEGQPADSQQALAAEARAAASQARGMPASAGSRGDPRAAAEELERAAGLQEDNADALADGDAEASAELGAESAAALAEALRELAAQLEPGSFDAESATAGYARMISDYLRAISYE